MVNKGENTDQTPATLNLFLLLVSLLATLAILPILEHWLHSRVAVYVGVTAVLIGGTFVNRRKSPLFLVGALLAVFAVTATWATLFIDYPALFVISCVLEAVFYFAVSVILLRSILNRHFASVQSVFGALCVYLLLGLGWAQLYWSTEGMTNEGISFARGELSEAERADLYRAKGPDQTVNFSEVVYFSFVTMSTLGFGDVVPETPIAKTLTWMQSVVGQFYLAVLVAWLVNAIPGERLLRKDGGGSPEYQDSGANGEDPPDEA